MDIRIFLTRDIERIGGTGTASGERVAPDGGFLKRLHDGKGHTDGQVRTAEAQAPEEGGMRPPLTDGRRRALPMAQRRVAAFRRCVPGGNDRGAITGTAATMLHAGPAGTVP